MGLRISFELSDDDLKHFRLIMLEARKSAANIPQDDIIDAARALLKEVHESQVPEFILERLSKLDIMTQMLTDSEWKLPAAETTRVLNALAYFSEPEDLVPDHIPGLGFLDDAIMVELVVRELRHEIDAYQDFCTYRVREEKRHVGKNEDRVTRDSWLKVRRQELQSRMRRRRRGERGRRKSGGARKSPFSLI